MNMRRSIWVRPEGKELWLGTPRASKRDPGGEDAIITDVVACVGIEIELGAIYNEMLRSSQLLESSGTSGGASHDRQLTFNHDFSCGGGAGEEVLQTGGIVGRHGCNVE